MRRRRQGAIPFIVGLAFPILAVLAVVMMMDEWRTGEAIRRGPDLLRAEDPTGFYVEMLVQGFSLLVLLGLGALALWSGRRDPTSDRRIDQRLRARSGLDSARRSTLTPLPAPVVSSTEDS